MNRRFTIGLSLCLNIWGGALPAQTRFAPPDTTVDLRRYASGQECFAALRRVNARIEAANPIWRDTLYIDHIEMLDSQASAARNVARECAVRHRADTLPVDQYEGWVSVFLAADRDADAKLIIDRRLATLTPDSVAARRLVLQRVYSAYTDSRPLRVAAMESVLTQLERLATGDQINDRFEPMGMQIALAQTLFDTTMERRAAERVVAFAETLTPQQRQDRNYEIKGRPVVHKALDIVRRGALRDSLRKSAMAFVALKQANWTAASGRPASQIPSLIGKPAAPIEADFWFVGNTATVDTTATNATTGSFSLPKRQTSRLVRPTPGRVGLLMFLQSSCHEEARWVKLPFGRESLKANCWGTYAMLRRLGQRFPNLEITIVSQTSGYIGSTAPLSPEDEANLLQQWWLDFHHLPATLAVTNTQFFRLPAPDNRRIDHGVANKTNYTAGDMKTLFQQRVFLVDPSGVIILGGELQSSGEKELVDILEVVMARYNQTSARQ